MLLGTGHFFSGWGVLLGFERGPRKNGFKGNGGRGEEKNIGCKVGITKKNSFKSRSDGICITANSLPECRKPAFLTFPFPGKACFWTPYLIAYYLVS